VAELLCKFVDAKIIMIARNTCFILLLAFCFFGCKKENESKPVDFKYSYFPLSTGHELFYNVTVINIDDTMHYFDTVRYELKERIDSMFIDNSGNEAWRIERYKRNDSTHPWVIIDVWVSQITKNQAQQVEENQRYVKIVFPPEINKMWDGNVYNTLGSKTFEISGVDEDCTINNLYFDSVLTVEQENNETLINKYHTFEKYANHFGLVQRDTIAIDYAYIIPGVPIEQRIRRAHFYYQTLIHK
jgi:hypothetical protein